MGGWARLLIPQITEVHTEFLECSWRATGNSRIVQLQLFPINGICPINKEAHLCPLHHHSETHTRLDFPTEFSDDFHPIQ